MSETTRKDPLIEPRCGGCAANEFEFWLNERAEGEEAITAAAFFMSVLEKTKQIVKENPALVRRMNLLNQELGEGGPNSERKYEKLGDYTYGNVAQFAVNCVVMQSIGTCRRLNPLKR